MRSVLRTPGVLAAFLPACIARLPIGALGLLCVLRTEDLTGSYARGGAVAAAFALAVGLSNPLLARIADRRGQTMVLVVSSPISALAITGLGLVPHGVPLAVPIACAAVAGAALPPVGAMLRALWPVLLPNAEMVHRAYATEGVMVEVIYILGPVAIAGGIGAWSTTAALVTCAVAVLVGDLVFARHPASRGAVPHPELQRDLAGALRGPGIRVMLVAFFTLGITVGGVEVAVPAALDDMGHRALTGVCLGLWGVGSVLGGLAMTRTRPPADPAARLLVLIGAWAVAHLALAAAGAPVLLGALLVVAGATIAPTFTVANGLLDRLAPTGTLTEAFTWTSTGLTAGAAAGSAVGGVVVEAADAAAALALLGAAALAGAGLLVLARGPLSRPLAAGEASRT